VQDFPLLSLRVDPVAYGSEHPVGSSLIDLKMTKMQPSLIHDYIEALLRKMQHTLGIRGKVLGFRRI
jgi:hypothetical protein